MQKEFHDTNAVEHGNLTELANELEELQRQKFPDGDPIMEKLLRLLRLGDIELAKIFLNNESDKFSRYRDDGIPAIIGKLYGGKGSPWFTIERKI